MKEQPQPPKYQAKKQWTSNEKMSGYLFRNRLEQLEWLNSGGSLCWETNFCLEEDSFCDGDKYCVVRVVHPIKSTRQ